MRFLTVKRRTLLSAVALILCTAVLIISIPYSGAVTVYYGKPLRKVPIYRVETEEKLVALSFDATWGSDKTEKIMEIVKSYNFTATFFLVGFWMDKNPELTKKIADNGFEIGTHSNVHAHMSKFSYEQSLSDLKLSMEKVEKYTGKKPVMFRPPFGEYNNNLINAAEALGLKTIQWDVDSLDWKELTAEQICNRVMSKTKEGSIVLFHNSSNHVLDVLPTILNYLSMKKFKAVNMSDLVYSDNYIIDSSGVQKKVNGNL